MVLAQYGRHTTSVIILITVTIIRLLIEIKKKIITFIIWEHVLIALIGGLYVNPIIFNTIQKRNN